MRKYINLDIIMLFKMIKLGNDNVGIEILECMNLKFIILLNMFYSLCYIEFYC